MYLVKTPRLLRWYYPSLTWHKDRDQKIVYLTFDDGPIPDVTPFVLKTLKGFGVKGTFFCIGENIIRHPKIYLQVRDEGHAIGNHTFNHLKGWKTGTDSYLDNFNQCQQVTQTPLFRPPYGRIKKSQARALRQQHPGLDIVMWDVLSGDFDVQLSPEQCLHNVTRHTTNGSIIVFHDSLKAFERLKYALPRSIEHLLAAGYTFSAL
ncbi:polysaccharide deacetylase family protein [Pedobacter yulinensis]|uniref:Polysaccharide deacetylase family protein n=1 Tax=Pedobacter yulinensis TaxID=2126353 RepID=A0A2T3HGQ3_9SPHI|nr:polysaccharide deacetylase family protein [Pedobacter yulinensis]PST81626.1 polysaccharide deacetylase family protein [Pedobacter yulinensis]